MNQWVNGWFIDIKTESQEWWFMAMFSDFAKAGGDWIQMPAVGPTDPARPDWQEFGPYAHPLASAYDPPLGDDYKGGRKGSGIAYTDPLQVLYDGPRKWIALSTTHLFDETGDVALVDVMITCIFDKVEKHVILLKDVKTRNVKLEFNIQFGNRGQWDLDLKGYAHFYTDEPVMYWDLDQNGTIEQVEEELSFEYFRQWMLKNKFPKKWWGDVYPDQLGPIEDDLIRLGLDNEMTPEVEYLETQPTTYAAYEWMEDDMWHVDENIHQHGYAVAQVIDTHLNYVGALAVWPHPEFWTVEDDIPAGDNAKLTFVPFSRLLEWDKWTDNDPMWIARDDMNEEPATPWIMYEHDFKLQWEVLEQYRVVSVYVLTDYHDADDFDAWDPLETGSGDLDDNGIIENKIDREVKYQLEEIFNSWDLRKAMRKEDKRWVEFFEGDGVTTTFCVRKEEEVEKGLIIPTIPLESVHDDAMTCAEISIDGCGSSWDQYCVPSEKVLVDGVLATPLRAIEDGAYAVNDIVYTVTPDGCFTFMEAPDEGSVIKVLWSSRHLVTKAEQYTNSTVVDLHGRFQLHHDVRMELRDMTEVFEVGGSSGPVAVLQQGMWVYNDGEIIINQPLEGMNPWMPYKLYLWVIDGQGSYVLSSDDALDYFKTVFPVRENLAQDGPEPATELALAYLNETYIPEDVWNALPLPRPKVGDDWEGGIIVDVKGPFAGWVEIEKVHITPAMMGPCPPAQYVIHETWECDEVVLNEELGILNDLGHEPPWPEIKIVYKFWSGRYEETVVGKDARSVDSIGAALVTAAIKNKNLEIGIGALDIEDPDYKASIPWVMRRFGPEYSVGDHYYEAGMWEPPDERTALRDDWCHTWPISSASVIGVGGPLANLLSYYANDFTQALFGIPRFTPSVWSGRIAAPTCWDKLNHHYSSFDDERYGYAVIATQKDKNNTIMLEVWGHFGRDTFYASQWFEFNKFWLQHMNSHVTAIILEIDYYDQMHPEFAIVEQLGTISEKPVHPDP
jgi:hypothetical protein